MGVLTINRKTTPLYDIVLLTSYPGLDEEARALIGSLDRRYSIKVTPYRSVRVSDQALLEYASDGRSVIISRGYPATVYKRYTGKHVIEIEVRFQDVIHAINRVIRPDTKRIGVFAYSNIIDEKNDVVRLGNFELHFLTLADRKKDREMVTHYVEQHGIDAVVGSAWAYETVKDWKVPFQMIRSGEDAIRKALTDAVFYLDRQKKTESEHETKRKMILSKGWTANYVFESILGESTAMQNCKLLARRYANTERNILIQGETGTGKELFAQSIHNESGRYNNPFVSINCSELTESLVESELFGYEKGAYTGAAKEGKEGLLLATQGGTIFLDEITETSINFQSKLLRVIEEKKVRRVGGDRQADLDVRFICSTNKPIGDLIQNGQFKQDLFYRISELELTIPPLRERGTDVFLLAKHFTETEFYNEYKRQLSLSPDLFLSLDQYGWPGNIRELKSFLVKLVYYSNGATIDKPMVDEFLALTYSDHAQPPNDFIRIPIIPGESQMQREMYQKVLLHYNGDQKRLCADFGISRSTLWRRLNGV